MLNYKCGSFPKTLELFGILGAWSAGVGPYSVDGGAELMLSKILRPLLQPSESQNGPDLPVGGCAPLLLEHDVNISALKTIDTHQRPTS